MSRPLGENFAGGRGLAKGLTAHLCLPPDIAPAARADFALNRGAAVRGQEHVAIIAAPPAFRDILIGDVVRRQPFFRIWDDRVLNDGRPPNSAPATRRNLSLHRLAGVGRNPNPTVVAALPAFRAVSIIDVALCKLVDREGPAQAAKTASPDAIVRRTGCRFRFQYETSAPF